MSELTSAREIDRICRAFETAWQDDGGAAQIEHWVQQAAEALRPQLLAQLLEIDSQLRAPQTVDVSTFDLDALLAEQWQTPSSSSGRKGQRQPQEVRGRLLACPTFAALSEEAAAALEQRLHPVAFAPDAHLIDVDQPAGGLFVIVAGEINVIAHTAEGPRMLDRCGSGSVLGEMSLLTGSPCTATVLAAGEVSALRLTVEDYQHLRVAHPEIEIAISQLVSDRLGGRKFDALHGKILGGYRFLECIGRGGMGVVYRAQRVQDGRAKEFAVKMLRHRFLYDSDAIEHFQRESELLVGIRHPNLIGVEEPFLAFRTRFLVMELCEGKDLAQQLAIGGPLREAQVLGLLGQFAAGLLEVHAHQILHLDLKPSNLMLSRDGTIRIADFGLCRLGGDQPASVVRGTPAYMAPEQLTGDAVDERTDWYAFACVVYELITGCRCFAGQDLMEVMLRKSAFDPDVPWADWPASAALGRLLAHALHPDPAQRVLPLEEIATWAAPVK